MTDEQAEEMLSELTAHFREPVMPLKRFCSTMKKGAACVETGVREKHPDAYQHGQEYSDVLFRVIIDIEKSCLLSRLFYYGQEPRTAKCPEHKGHWSGLEWRDPRDGRGNVCPHGCGLTGWLP